jgi:hypothetical protein
MDSHLRAFCLYPRSGLAKQLSILKNDYKTLLGWKKRYKVGDTERGFGIAESPKGTFRQVNSSFLLFL